MYLRKSKKPNGRTYLTIVQGYRDAGGKNRARTVKSLGYVDALEAEFDDPVAHFEEECRRMTAEAARAEAPIAVEFTASRATRFLNTVLKDLKLKPGLLIAAIVRGEAVIIPNGDDMILAGDRVIVVARTLFLHDLNDILKG